MSKTITTASTVTLHFMIKLEDGSIAENTRIYKKPARFTMGDGSLSENFEALLIGLAEGEKKQFVLAPEDAFGLPDPKNVHVLPRAQFAKDLVLEVGLIMAFQQPNGVELPGIIRGFDAEQVTVDFNHPLCGRALTFDVEILAVG